MPNEPSPSDLPPDPAVSSTASEPESGSSDELVADPGPRFDPEAEPEWGQLPPAPEPEAQAEVEEWDPEVIKSILATQGRLLHFALGVTEQDWIYTEADLAAIAPPMRRILNRYDPTRELAKHGDPIALALAFGGGYVGRSLMERKEALKAQAPPETETPIEPLQEGGPAPAPPPQQGVHPTAPPTQPPPAPPPGPAPVQAEVDPTTVAWSVGGGGVVE